MLGWPAVKTVAGLVRPSGGKKHSCPVTSPVAYLHSKEVGSLQEQREENFPKSEFLEVFCLNNESIEIFMHLFPRVQHIKNYAWTAFKLFIYDNLTCKSAFEQTSKPPSRCQPVQRATFPNSRLPNQLRSSCDAAVHPLSTSHSRANGTQRSSRVSTSVESLYLTPRSAGRFAAPPLRWRKRARGDTEGWGWSRALSFSSSSRSSGCRCAEQERRRGNKGSGRDRVRASLCARVTGGGGQRAWRFLNVVWQIMEREGGVVMKTAPLSL